MEAARSMEKPMIAQHQRDHGLDDRNRPRKHARIVSAARLELGRLALAIDGRLLLLDGRDRLESDADDDGHPVRDAALDSPRVVRARAHRAVDCHEWIVVLGTTEPRSREPRPDLDAARSRKGKECLAEIGLELVGYRL